MDQSKELLIEICRKCSLECKFCSSNSTIKKNDFVSINYLKQIAEDLNSMGFTEIQISGGEPLLHPDIFEFLSLINNNCNKIIYSNGNYLVNGEIVPIPHNFFEISKKVNVSTYRFNLQSHIAKIHDYLTEKKGSFENLLISIRNAQNAGLKTEIHLIPNKLNYEKIEDSIKFFKSINVCKVKFLRFLSSGRGASSEKELEIDISNNSWIENINKIKEKYGDFVEIGAAFNDSYCAHTCTFGLNKFVITPDLFVYPCVSVKNLDYFKFNLKNSRFNEIIKSPEYKSTVKKFLSQYKRDSSCPSQNYVKINHI